MSFGPRVLLVDDEADFREFVKTCLEKENYRILEAADGDRGLQMALEEKPDLVVLDIEMPGLNGIAVCAELRRLQFPGPILMLTSRKDIEHRVRGLNTGADDYLAKPFDHREFLARIKALLRRQQQHLQKCLVLQFGDARVDLEKRTATRAGTPLKLTKTEFALLDLLAKNAGKPVSRERILDSVWGYTYFPTTRTVDTHVYRLRKKLGGTGDQSRWIKKIQGEGYCLSVSVIIPSPQ